jgi:hypothetical protein
MAEYLQFHRIPCINHMINLICKEKVLASLHSVKSAHDLVVACHNSGDIVHELEVIRGVYLSLDVQTRWNSTVIMLRSIVKHKQSIVEVLSKVNRLILLPSDSDFAEMTVLCDLLSPYEEATELFTRSDSVTMSYVCVIYSQLLKLTNACETVDDENTQGIKRILFQGLLERFLPVLESTVEFRLATFLDPRFKKQLFTFNICTVDSLTADLIAYKEKLQHII